MRNDADNKQMALMLFLTITAVTTIGLPQTLAKAAGTGAWIPVLLTSIIYAFGAMMIVALNRKFQGEVLFDYSKRLVGKAGSYALGAFYLLYFLSISSFLCASMTNVLVSNFFARTPRWVIILFSVPFYGYAAYKGITSIARMCLIYGTIYITITGFAYILMFVQGDVRHILPLFVKQDVPSYLRAVLKTVPSFLGIEVLTLIPIARKGRDRAPWVAFFTVIAVGVFFMMNVESCIMMSGINEIRNQNNALISAIRQIQLPGLSFFERMDFIYLTAGFTGLFAAKAVAMLAAVEYGCKLFPKVKRVIGTCVVALIVSAVSITLFSVENIWGIYDYIFLYMGNFGALVVPLAFHLLAKVKPNAAQAV